MTTRTHWAFASTPDAEQWHDGGATREEAIKEGRLYYGDEDFYIHTGHPSDANNPDDCDPDEYAWTVDAGTPELVTTETKTTT